MSSAFPGPTDRQARPSKRPAPPLHQPYSDAPIMVSVSRVFRKYATLSGRASRSEFWWWAGIAAVIGMAFLLLATAVPGRDGLGLRPGIVAALVMGGVWGLVILVPTFALACRRLHDTNRRGAWLLLVLIPYVGWVILIVFFAGRPKPAGRRFDR